MKFTEDRPGHLIPLDEEASACVDRMNQPFTESARNAKEVGNSELREARMTSHPTEIPGLVRVKVDIPLPAQRRQEDSFVRMGFSREEARIAAGTDNGK